MGYAVIDSANVAVMGDRDLTEYLKQQADALGGIVIDDNTLETVYPAPVTVEEDISTEREETGS